MAKNSFSASGFAGMKFQIRIISVTLAILVITLGLNSVLSLASFEKAYVASLVSNYELVGRNLKRKIEQSLRFGKPLEQFKGMERLLAEVTRSNPDVASVGIVSLDGKILHHTDPELAGTLFPYAVPHFAADSQVQSSLVGSTYLTFIPLLDRTEKVVGLVSLSFPREIILKKVKGMALENLRVLWVLILVASAGLIGCMAWFITRPLRKEILGMSDLLERPDSVMPCGECLKERQKRSAADTDRESRPGGKAEAESVPNLPAPASDAVLSLDVGEVKSEVQRLRWHICSFVKHTRNTMEQIRAVEKRKADMDASARRLLELNKELRNWMDNPLTNDFDKLDTWERESLRCLVQENEAVLHALHQVLSVSVEKVPDPATAGVPPGGASGSRRSPCVSKSSWSVFASSFWGRLFTLSETSSPSSRVTSIPWRRNASGSATCSKMTSNTFSASISPSRSSPKWRAHWARSWKPSPSSGASRSPDRT